MTRSTQDALIRVAYSVVLGSVDVLQSPEDRAVLKRRTYIVYIHPVLVDKKALEQTLNDYETFTKNQHDCVQPGAGAMEDSEERKLRQKSECEEEKVHNERDYGQG